MAFGTDNGKRGDEEIKLTSFRTFTPTYLGNSHSTSEHISLRRVDATRFCGRRTSGLAWGHVG